MAQHPVLLEVTQRIVARSAGRRTKYLAQVDRLAGRARGSDRMGCANVAHAFAAMPANDKLKIVAERAPHIGIVTAYNDMLRRPPALRGLPGPDPRHRRALGRHGAGGRRRARHVRWRDARPARHGAEPVQPRHHRHGHSRLRLSHDVFDGGLAAGHLRQDRARPADRRAALSATCPRSSCPAGPMSLGPFKRRQGQGARALCPRQGRARGAAARPRKPLTTAPAPAPSTALPIPTRCCWKPWACMCPAAAFVHPHTGLRQALTDEAVRLLLDNTASCRFMPIGRVGGRALHRQRHGGPAGHRRQHQPPDPLGGGGCVRPAFQIDWRRLLRTVWPWCPCWPVCTRTAPPM